MNHRTIEEIGPGIWFMLHFDGKFAVTNKLKDEYENKVQTLANNFPCAKCRPHFITLIKEIPLSLFRAIFNEKEEDIGFFKWSVIVHNNVNRRLGKKEYSFEEAYNFWYPSGSNHSNINGCPQCYDPSTEELVATFEKVEEHHEEHGNMGETRGNKFLHHATEPSKMKFTLVSRYH